jgi:glycosyltransferase involved in cell wall biosynthesis
MKNSKKTLILLSPGFPHNEMDSTCLPAQQALVRSINALFPACKIIILAFQYPYTHRSYDWYGNTVIPFNGKNRNKPYRWIVWLQVWRTLKKLNIQDPLIGLFSFWLDECALIGHYFSKKNQLPHFTWILGQDARKNNPYAKIIPLQPASLVAMSDFLAKKIYENYSVKPGHIITNGIDPNIYQHTEIKKDIDIIGVGSLIPLKRYDLFIGIIKDLRRHFPTLKVMICGKGPEQERLEKLIRQNDLTNTIQLTGEKNHGEVLHLLQRSKLMLHTSCYEGFSGACLEALYAGAHVISFFSPQNGWIRHWHIADDLDGMIRLSKELLQSADLDHSPALPYKMADSARAIMTLFNYSETATS